MTSDGREIVVQLLSKQAKFNTTKKRVDTQETASKVDSGNTMVQALYFKGKEKKESQADQREHRLRRRNGAERMDEREKEDCHEVNSGIRVKKNEKNKKKNYKAKEDIMNIKRKKKKNGIVTKGRQKGWAPNNEAQGE